MPTAVILEDESIASRRLKRMLEELYGEDLVVLETFQSVKDLADYLMHNPHPDILFQDIMVADGNSFDLFDILQVKSRIIFTTAYDEFAIRALRNNAVDYLLKPLKKGEVIKAVERASRPKNLDEVRKEISPFKERFLIRFGNKLYSVKTTEIAYIYSEDKLSFFVLKDEQKVPCDFPLHKILLSLDPELFFRVNRFCIVHIDSIENMIRYSRSRINLRLIPAFDKDIIISTENTPRFKEWMQR